jgi:type IX secretion system PorP/SprF family membrane protein
MKKLFTLLNMVLLAGIFNALDGQQIPIFNQNMFETRFHNPAAFGSDDGSIQLAYRRQFLSLSAADAPVTFQILGDLSAPLGLDSRRIGLGLSVSSDKVHVTNRSGGTLSFAYHLVQSETMDFSAGISAGFSSFGLNTTGRRIDDISDAALYEISEKKGGLQAGTGLYLKFKSSESQFLQVSLAVPQIYSKELKFASGSRLQQNGHLLASISYRLPIGEAIQIEPALMMRGTLKDKCKAGQYDVAARVHFLENKIWVGGGLRLTKTPGGFHAGFGVRPISKLSISGDYENHSKLGGSYEISAQYFFNQSEKSGQKIAVEAKPKPVHPGQKTTPPTVKPAPISAKAKANKPLVKELKTKTSVINGQYEQLGTAKTAFNNLLKNVRTPLSEITPTSSPETIAFKAKKGRENLEIARKSLENVQSVFGRIENIQKDAQKSIETAYPNGIVHKDVGAEKTNLDATVASSKNMVAGAQRDFDQLEKQVAELEKRAEESVDFSKLISENKLEAAAKMLQKELDTLKIKPRNLESVKLSTEGNSTIIAFQFPEESEKFNVGRDLKDVKGMAAHISKKVKEWQSKGFIVESVVVRADLGITTSGLKEKTETTYDGSKLTGVTYNFLDRDRSSSFSSKNLDTPKSTVKLTFEQLVGLKMNSLAKQMEQLGLGGVTPKLEMTLGNKEQDFTQLYSISVKIRK